MNLPPLHNSRAPQQWEIISKHVDFAGKTVLDLGCGGGDIILRCLQAGAKAVTGIDRNRDILAGLAGFAVDNAIPRDELFLIKTDFNDTRYLDMFGDVGENLYADVIICFSVIPYLDNATAILDWMKAHSEIALIECQYDGDGPGSVPWLSCRVGPDLNEYQRPPKDDDQMREILAGIGWQSIKPIGKTLVEGRQMWRTIWMCQQCRKYTLLISHH